jgi:pyrroline-5-carboxylate reductase
MKDLKISLIGCGKMASALSLGIHKKFPNLKFFGFNRTPVKAQDLMEKINGLAFGKISELPSSDIYLLGVKPQQFDEMAKMTASYLNSNSLIISMIAGINCETISKKFNSNKIIRIMPNTPCAVGEGVVSIFFHKSIGNKEKDLIKNIFHAVGLVFELTEEEQINTSTVFTGSGPGFLFEIARIMHSKILEKGINVEISKKMIGQTFLGAAKQMIESDESFETLRNNVSSKGGTTEAGLNILNQKNLTGILNEALEASLKRCSSLSDNRD